MRVVVAATLLFFNASFALWMLYGEPPRSRAAPIPTTVPGIQPLALWSETHTIAADVPAVPPLSALTAPPPLPAPAADPTPPEPRPDEPATPETQPASRDTPDGGAIETKVGQCQAVGPYGSRLDAKEAAARLGERQEQFTVVPTQTREQRFWVYLPPFVSRSAAMQGERELRAKGVRDIQVLAGDEKENGISLGLYRERSAAQRRLEQLRALGYAPRMDVIHQRRSYFWLQAPASGPGSTESQWRTLLAPGLRLETRPCAPEVAS